jgi:hypothetical protein
MRENKYSHMCLWKLWCSEGLNDLPNLQSEWEGLDSGYLGSNPSKWPPSLDACVNLPAIADWTRGKHLTKAGPIRFNLPGIWLGNEMVVLAHRGREQKDHMVLSVVSFLVPALECPAIPASPCDSSLLFILGTLKCFFFFSSGSGVWIQHLTLAKQMLLPVSHSASPKLLIFFCNRNNLS